MMKLWAAINAGGHYKDLWDATDKLFYFPLFISHERALQFWHGRTEERKAWAIASVHVTSYINTGLQLTQIGEKE